MSNTMDQKKPTILIGIIMIIIAAAFSSFGQLFWKFGADGGSLVIFWYIIGFVAAGIGMVLLMLSFRFGPVSILQPMMSLGFAMSIFWGAIFLSESITLPKILGTLLIIGGSAVLGIEGNKEAKKS